MAKDLPYFKFKVADWLTGNITSCSMAAQGLFINLCAMYWARGGDLMVDFVLKKFKPEVPELAELRTHGVIAGDVGQKLVISFLDEQLDERNVLSSTNSQNGKLGAEAKKASFLASAKRAPKDTSGEIKQYREEERRKEKRRGEEKGYTNPFGDFWVTVANHWQKYLDFRKQLDKPYKSQMSECAAISELFGLAQAYNNQHNVGIANVARFIIDQSIKKEWLGLFKPKTSVPTEAALDQKPISHADYFKS